MINFVSLIKKTYLCEPKVRIYHTCGSLMRENDFILSLYKAKQTVFCLSDISMLLNESNFIRLKQKINYYVHTKAINSPRRGVYSKTGYNKEELACKIYVPSYISLEYVLNKAGIIFQYNEQITVVSYLSRSIVADSHKLGFRKIKNQVLLNTSGILRGEAGINIASPERAFLDVLYLNKDFYFDNVSLLNKEIIQKFLLVYNSNQLNMRVNKILKNA